MAFNTLSARLARVFAVLRGAMLVFFAVVFIVLPERALPGSSADPARALGLMFASRTSLLGLALIVLAVRARWTGLAWVLFADAALQVFDAGLALATHKGALALLPILIGGFDVWAAVTLRARAGREP